MEPHGACRSFKGSQSLSSYVKDEIEGQREKIHLFNPSSARASFPPSSKDSSNTCQVQETQQCIREMRSLLSSSFCSDGEREMVNLELEATPPRLVGGHRAEQ